MNKSDVKYGCCKIGDRLSVTSYNGTIKKFIIDNYSDPSWFTLWADQEKILVGTCEDLSELVNIIVKFKRENNKTKGEIND